MIAVEVIYTYSTPERGVSYILAREAGPLGVGDGNESRDSSFMTGKKFVFTFVQSI